MEGQDMFELEILSYSLGNANRMLFNSTTKLKGITGDIKINKVDITRGKWAHLIGLSGETTGIMTNEPGEAPIQMVISYSTFGVFDSYYLFINSSANNKRSLLHM